MFPALMGKKKAGSLVLGMGDESEPKEESEGGDSLHTIAKEVMSAFESKSVEGLASALKAFFAECDSQEDGEDEES
jgi:hypothetical protein